MDRLDKIEPDVINVRELIAKFKAAIKDILSKWKILIASGLLGLLVGLLYVALERPDYMAVSTFVLEEAGHGGGLGLSQYAGIASMAGIDIGGASEKGLFQGDNILELYRSRRMIQKTLLTPVEIEGKNQLLVDRYIEAANLKEKWANKDNLKNLNFNGDAKNFNRTQDSVLREFTKYFNKYILSVSKPDKKLSIINVVVKFKDETFAQLFNKQLVGNVNDFYIQTQTRKTSQNVRILQHQADSIRSILNNSIGKVAESVDINPNPNPTLHSLQVPSQKKQIDLQSNGAIYTEIVKNLEIAKISLRQETPLIQIIDEPITPLDDDKVGIIKAGLTGLIAGVLLSFCYLLAVKFNKFIKKI